ncbi:MAG: multicopper oxidase family protein [Nannocystaceae bacterium]
MGCGADAAAAPEGLPQLRAAVDIDDDPHVVEVELVAEVATVELLPGRATEVWAYRDANAPQDEATVPGPSIEAALGDTLIVHLRNELPEGTTLHWHGLRLPQAMDGNPDDGVLAPGATTTVRFELQDPGLHWYHSHRSADVQTERGLQGTLVVRDPAAPPLGVDRERVLVLDDIALADDGEPLLEPSQDDIMLGRRSGTVLVNGAPPGHARARRGAYERWRVVNASNGRFFALALPHVALRVIGWDGGPVAQPYDVDTLVIAPGERYDLVVRMPETDAVVLRSEAVARGGGAADPAIELLQLQLHGPTLRAAAPRLDPVAVPALPIDAGTPVRRLELEHRTGNGKGAVFTIDGQRWPLAPALHVEQGALEVIELVNRSPHEHPFHLHGMRFQVLDRDGVAPPVAGWKDTVSVTPGGTTRLAVRYDALGMWMLHCSIPEHAERGMMRDVHVMAAPPAGPMRSSEGGS